MYIKQSTQLPNVVVDTIMTEITGAELKLLLLIIRQTYGWQLPNGQRKQRDRIAYSQFISKTKLSRRIIATSLQSLINKGYITATDYFNNSLSLPEERKGKTCIYYAPNVLTNEDIVTRVCSSKHKEVQKPMYNKTNGTKLNKQNVVSKFEQKEIRRLSDTDRFKQILQEQQQRRKT